MQTVVEFYDVVTFHSIVQCVHIFIHRYPTTQIFTGYFISVPRFAPCDLKFATIFLLKQLSTIPCKKWQLIPNRL